MLMPLYSLLVAVALVISAPWWILRMLTTARYREGLLQRLGLVPPALRAFIAGRKTVWLHAVSVGEVLAASRIVEELDAQLGSTHRLVISTTTRTGQALARQRFGANRVFYFPLDLAFAVRAYLNLLRPSALLLMESELWPRLLHECATRSIPVAVLNARVSDRSFARALRIKPVWQRLVRKPTLWLAQSQQDADRLIALGADPTRVHNTGNLKYDIRAPQESPIATTIREAAQDRPIIVAGSTVEGEEEIITAAFYGISSAVHPTLLIVAPRHPERFAAVTRLLEDFGAVPATQLLVGDASKTLRQTITRDDTGVTYTSNTLAIVLDTIGDLATVYGIADVAFVGGSFVNRGGHNPLEPARFGVPIIMGPSFHNFNEVVSDLIAVNAIRIVGTPTDLYPGELPTDKEGLREAERVGDLQDNSNTPGVHLRQEFERVVIELLRSPDTAHALGERARAVFESQQGATQRTLAHILPLLQERTQ